MSPIRSAVLGTPVSSGNRGVLALGSALASLLAGKDGENEVLLMLGRDSDRSVPLRIRGQLRAIAVVNCRLSPRSRLSSHLGWILVASLAYRCVPLRGVRLVLRRSTPWIAALEDADLVGDVRGGDSFSDIYGMGRFVYGFVVAWTVLLVKGRMVQFPQTFGPFKSPLARFLARYILSRSRPAIARDEESRQVALALAGSEGDVWLSPDVAFALDSIRPMSIESDPPLEGDMPVGVIGLNVNGLMANGGYTRDNMFDLKMDYRSFLPELVTALLAVHPGELWLVPHTYGPPGSVESDPEACLRVRRELPRGLLRRVRIVLGEYDQHEIKGLIGQCDFFVGSRMHACIAALSQGVPCVGVAYSRKFAGVFASVGMNEWVVDSRETTNALAVARIVELYRRRDSIRTTLARNANTARARLLDIFQQLVSSVVREDVME